MRTHRHTRPAPGSPRDMHIAKRVKHVSTGEPAKMPANGGSPPFPQPTRRLGIDELTNLMVGQRLDSTFRALADPTRRAMLARLLEGPSSVAGLTRGFAMSEAGAAKHLATLEAAGLVRRVGEDRRSLRALDADPLVEAGLWLRGWQRLASPRMARTAALLDAAARLP